MRNDNSYGTPNGLTLYRKFDRGPFSHVLSEFEELFERALREPVSGSSDSRTREWIQPRVELDEKDGAYLLSVDLPGVKREDLKIDVNQNILTVSGERRRVTEIVDGSQKGAQKRETFYGRFERSFTLPDTVDPDHIEAHLEDGVLALALPKRANMKPRSIEVNSGKSGFFSRLVNAATGSTSTEVKTQSSNSQAGSQTHN